LFSKSPVKRIGRDRFVRNVLIAIGNSSDPGLMSEARTLMNDPSPLVRAMAVWALRRLGGDVGGARNDPDEDVRAEAS
jgi:epoxyqueuosine reductase